MKKLILSYDIAFPFVDIYFYENEIYYRGLDFLKFHYVYVTFNNKMKDFGNRRNVAIEEKGLLMEKQDKLDLEKGMNLWSHFLLEHPKSKQKWQSLKVISYIMNQPKICKHFQNPRWFCCKRIG